MGARKIAYAEMEGGLYLPWTAKPPELKPSITIWADGKVKDEILEEINRKRGTSYGRKKFTRRMAIDIAKCAYQNVKDYNLK